jgi:hypothetical protein
VDDSIMSECLAEERRPALTMQVMSELRVNPLIVKVENFGSLKKLIRVMARTFQFIRRLRWDGENEISIENVSCPQFPYQDSSKGAGTE